MSFDTSKNKERLYIFVMPNVQDLSDWKKEIL